ncbi:hypothetical protein HYPBUDRAFT_152225 [Hyphopichia burtonii NRRL Y-1933]|uniref:Nucleoporin NUP49/NSP49 n=1 Tax=Hyphopichia burtonii NRRL Y-1933 TaxID=984485 RepID=A0A1E4RNZ0_9ASCO|nr:hypothetical protein HYPBUDRAFT_152225 [Hyphopichia burtonii NRRL Y-1933]ODV68988.1 hypothetical protein HYPBUDRAFT_152225 [Hyphopichia burtonii NRRL Y-1933]
MFGNSGNSSFGGFGANKPASGFGTNPTAPAAPAASGGLFGSNNTTANSTSGGLFGGSSNTNPSTNTQSNGGMFGSNTNTQSSGGMFGSNNTNQSTTGGGLFGSKPATGGGLFGSNPSNPGTGSGTGSSGFSFGNTNNPQNNTTGGGLFGGSNNNTTSSTSGGLFGNNNNNQTSSGGLFGNKPASGGLFGGNTSNNTSGGGLFGGANSNQQQQQQQQQQQETQLTAMTRVGDLPPAVKKELEDFDTYINTQHLIATTLKSDMYKHDNLIKSINKDTDYLYTKLSSTKQALKFDSNQLLSLKEINNELTEDINKMMHLIIQLSTPGTRLSSSFQLNEFFVKKIKKYYEILDTYQNIVKEAEEVIGGLERSCVEGFGGLFNVVEVVKDQYNLFMELCDTIAQVHNNLGKLTK